MQKTKSIQSLLSNAQYQFASNTPTPYESGWAYACIRAISNNIAGVPFKLRNSTGKIITDRNDKWFRLFHRPNPLLNTMQLLWQQTVNKYEIYGQCFWLFNDPMLNPATGSKITRIDVVDSAIPLWHPDNPAVQIGWRTGVMQYHDYTFDQCIRFANVSPAGRNNLSVLSPKMIAQTAINLDVEIHNYNQVFFENGAQINGYLQDKGDNGNLDDDEIKKIRDNWEATFGGTGNAHKTPVLTGGLEYIKTGISHKDMDFETLQSVTREEILAIFGVPDSQLSVGNAAYASAKVADRQFFTNNLIPKMEYFTSVINSTILYLSGYQCFFDYTTIEPLKEERGAKMEGAKALFELGYSLNQINTIQQLGMDMVSEEWANKAVDARQFINPLSSSGKPSTSEPITHGNQGAAQDGLYPKE
jgi:HK97 family phage portal protein